MNTLNRHLLFLLVVSMFFFSGCFWKRVYVHSTTFADVEKIPSGFPSNSSFTVLSSKNENALFEKEITQKIETILKQKGFNIKNKDLSDYYLLFDANINSEKQTVNVLHYLPGTTQRTQGSIYGAQGAIGYNEQKQSGGSFVYIPEEITVFTGALKIYVYDAQKYRSWFGKKEELIWSGVASSSGDNPDLRDLINYFLVTIFKDFGTSTGKFIARTIWASEVEELENPRQERTVLLRKGTLRKALDAYSKAEK